jgi:hypothetical protein
MIRDDRYCNKSESCEIFSNCIPNFLVFIDNGQEVYAPWHPSVDMSGAVLLFEAPTVEAVEAALPNFPMITKGLLTCGRIVLKPYDGLDSLFKHQ